MPRKQPKHDSFFSGSLELIPIALAFFRQHIPGHLQQIVESRTITRIDRKNTDAKLKQRLRDIIYQTSLYPNGTCYCTVEHQSQPKFDMPLRLLQYQLDTIRIHRQAGNKSWPMVVSLLFYHGKTAPYPYPCRSTDYYEYPHWSDQQLYFQFYLIDITQISDKEILAHGICAPMELLLKHSRDGSFELPVEAYRPIFQECIRRVGDEYVTTMLVYAANLTNLKTGEKIYNFIESALENKKDMVMTYAQKIKQTGIQEGFRTGIEKGRKEGIKETARNMLIGLQLGLDTVQKATHLSKGELEAILRENR